MTLRRAKRPLTGRNAGRVDVVFGNRPEGHPAVSITPTTTAASGVITTRDPMALRGLAADLVAAAEYLEEAADA